MAEGSQVLFVNTRTGEAVPAVKSIGTASISFDQLPASVTADINSKVNRSGDTMTGPLIVPSNFLVLKQGGSAEGGEIHLQMPTSTNLAGDVIFDSFVNSIRIFEAGGSFRGANLDLTQLAAGAGSRILTAPEDAPGLVLLTSGGVSAAATLDVALTAFTAYSEIKFRAFLRPASDDVELWMRFSTDGGGSFITTASYSFATMGLRDDGTDANNVSTGSGQIVVAGDAGAAQSVYSSTVFGGAFVEINVLGRTNAARHTECRFDTTYVMDGAVSIITTRQSGSGRLELAQDTDALRFLFESGNIASGEWSLYGYR